MRARVIAESLIVAVATCTSPAQRISAPPTKVGETGVYARPLPSQIPATGPIFQTPLTQVQPLAVTPVSDIGPAVDMDNRRRDEDEARKRQQEQQLREQARRDQEFRARSRPYGYAYSPAPNARPPQGYYYDPRTGHYYQYRDSRNYNTPNSGPSYQPYYYQPPDYHYPSGGYKKDNKNLSR